MFVFEKVKPKTTMCQIKLISILQNPAWLSLAQLSPSLMLALLTLYHNETDKVLIGSIDQKLSDEL